MSRGIQDESLAPLIGRRLRSVEKHDSTWMFFFDAEVAICTEAYWRWVTDGGIRGSSHDDGHVFGLPAPIDALKELQELLVGRTVEAATVVPDTGDLTLAFGRSTRLEMLQLSIGYESWGLSSARGRTICAGGGKLVHFPPE